MAADSTCSLKFGPEWIRVLSDSSAGQTSQPQPTQATPPRKYPLAKHRYGKEELIAIYEQTLYGDNVPPLSTPGFIYCDGVYIEQSQTPRSLIPMTDEEQRLWAFQRVASSRGRGRGITPAPWAAARSVGGHLQQTRNWRSPEKPMSSSGTQSALSTSSQFNYWRKNSLNEDEKVPEWADEKVPEDNDNVGSFDEKGGFLSLENRGRVVDTVPGGPSSSRDSFLQRSVVSGAESEPQPTPASTLRSGNLESNVSKTPIDKPTSSTVQPSIDREAGFSKREHSRDSNEKESNEIPVGNSIPCSGATITSSPTGSRLADDARLSLSQSKRAQVVILSAGPGTIDSIPAVGGGGVAEQDITTSASSDRPLQQNSQWTTTANRDIAEAPLWYYKDPQGIIQGPFSSADMLEWSNQGYFHDSLECRRACDPVFNPLGALKKVWNGTLPFYMPNLHGPISTLLSASPSSSVFNVSNVSMGLGVNTLNSSQALNGFVGSGGGTSVAVSSMSPITSITSALCSENSYFEESNPQFSTLTQHQSDFEGRIRQMPNGSDVGNDPISVGHSTAASRVHLEPELRDLESSIRRSVEDHPFNQTVNNHMTVSSSTTTNHQRGIISNRLIEHVSNSSSTVSATTTAPSLEQQADVWFSRSPSTNSNIGYHRGDMISQSVNPVMDPVTAHHRTIAQHELPDSWLVQRKNERNAEEILRSSTHHDEAEHLALNGGSWNDFEYGDSTNTGDVPPPATTDEDHSISHQGRQRSEQLLQHLLIPGQEQSEGSHTREQLTAAEEAPFEKVVEKKKKKDRKEKQREEKLLREKQERESDDQRKQLAQQNSTDEEVDWDSGEQNAAGRMSSYHEVIIPAPAPAVPAWGNTQDKAMSALSLQEIQRLEEERASKERQQRQQEAVKNGYHSGIRTWANAIAPTKSFDQIQKEQQASKASGVQSKQQAKGTPASYPPLLAADVVANGIGGSPSPKGSSSKTVTKMSSAQVVRSSVTISYNISNNNNNNNGPTAISNHHSTINNNGGERSAVANETTNNEQQLIDWCAQITKGLNSYLDMPTVVSILKDVESEAEIEDYVSQFFGESLKEPRQFARQFVQKRAKFNVGLASSLPKQSEWCTTGGNKKRKGTKK